MTSTRLAGFGSPPRKHGAEHAAAHDQIVVCRHRVGPRPASVHAFAEPLGLSSRPDSQVGLTPLAGGRF